MLSVKPLTFTELQQKLNHNNGDSSNSIFDDINWFFLLETHIFKEPEYICCYLTVHEGDRPILVFPLIMPGTKKTKRFFHPSEIESSSNYYSTYFCPPTFCKEDDLQLAYLELAKYIKQHIKADKITLKPFVLDSNNYQNIINMLSKAGFYIFPYFMHGNWVKNIATESFDEYYSSLSSRLKNTIKRKEKKSIKELGEYRIEIVDKNLDSIDQYISDYESIYKKSWKKSEPHEEFIRNLIKLHASKGELRLGLLYQNDRPLAAQIWFIKNRTAYIFKLAYDPEYKQYSVGSILSKALFQSAIDNDQVKVIDYLTGDDSYKQDWMGKRRELWGVLAYNKFSFKGIIYSGYEKIKRLLKR